MRFPGKEKAEVKTHYRRALLKLSGESVGGPKGRPLDPGALSRLAASVKEIQCLGVELAIVIGGGNILRGLAASSEGLSRRAADYMGMTATIINALALEDGLQQLGVGARVLTPIGAPELGDPYVPREAVRHLEEGRVVILAGGTGHPYFTTDTAAALRAVEVGAQALLKATKVDGVYSADPLEDPGARKFDSLSYREFLQLGLRVMDATAVLLCMDHLLPIIVFNLDLPGGVTRVLRGEPVGTLIGEG